MDQRTTRSAEFPSGRARDRGFLGRALDYYLTPVTSYIQYWFQLRKWSHHSDDRTLEWDWGETHFNRIAVVNLLLGRFRNPTYLEIGCASNALFSSIPCVEKIGVDPASGGTVRMTSDEFFKTNTRKFDVVFLDGLHTYEQVRRDVVHAIEALNDGGWIALHDMLPRNWIEHHVPIISMRDWTGDVWKVAFELVQTEGIEFKILKIDRGVGVIKVTRPGVRLKDRMEELLHQEFAYYYDNLGSLPIVEWGEAQTWMRGE